MEKKRIFVIYIFIVFAVFSTGVQAGPGKTSLSGKITDAKTGEALTGVSVYVPELQAGAISDLDGKYLVENLPQIKILIQLSFVGYTTILDTVDLLVLTHKDYKMEISVRQIHVFTVTGTSEATEIKRDAKPITLVDKLQLQQTASTNIVDAISKTPGINAVTTGPNVSKPFIRGLGFNRILTLYDGSRQEGQQWGDEHGIEVDEYAVDRVEVVKGPASLTYGSDALAGVVNLLTPKPPANNTINGELLSNYQSNNGLTAISGSFAGNKSGFIFGGRGAYKMAKDYQNKYDGRVYNTGFSERDADGFLGLNRHWGFTRLNFSIFDDLQEIPDGSRDSVTRKFTKQISEDDTLRPIVSESDLNSYAISPLHQHVQHYRIYSSSNLILGKTKLSVNFGYQLNHRQEFSHPVLSDIPGLDLQLQTWNYDLKFSFPKWKGFETCAGINGMIQNNQNKGTEFIIPDYNLMDIGPFIYIKKAIKRFDLSGGVRLDTRTFNMKQMFVSTNPITGFDMQTNAMDSSGTEMFYAGRHVFNGVSGSVGATFNITDEFLLKANIARGFRTPNIAELSANGVHPGTNIYQLGNTHFLPEFSLQEDFGMFLTKDHLKLSAEVFVNNITNYIYNEKLLSSSGSDSIIVPGNQTFQFQAARAQLLGGELIIDIHPHPLDWLHFENGISIIYAENKGIPGRLITDSSKYLPFIPPAHLHTEIRGERKKKIRFLSNAYASVEMEMYAKQNRVYKAFDTETETPGYVIFGAGIGSGIVNKKGKTVANIFINASNLTDVAYQAHLSRLKYFEQYPDTPSGRSGIYNMGRNISVKVTLPLDFKKVVVPGT